MPPSPDPIDFEHFPHRPLAFRATRRKILSTTVADSTASNWKEQGRPAPHLTDVGILPPTFCVEIIRLEENSPACGADPAYHLRAVGEAASNGGMFGI